LWTVDRWLPPIGASHIGTSHVATELPNQDSYQVEQWDDQQATFAAISDGHGSKKYWRSDSGSRLAVQALKELIENQFLPLIRDPDNDPERIKSAWELIGRDLRKKWLQLCAENLYDHPFSEEENRKAVEEHPDVIEHPVIVYGATMSGALLFQDYGFFIHLGDGDLIGCDPEGKAESIFEEPEIKANDTASMCQPDAHRAMRTKVIEGDSWKQMRMIVLATDGVGDAFGGDEVSLQDHAENYLRSWRKGGAGNLQTRLQDGEMKQFADTSGDDSTLLLLKRVEKEDQLTRGDFEKAWIAFEDKAQAHEATSVEAIKHTGSQVHSQVSQTSKAALAQMEEIKKTSSDVLQHVELTRVRLEELEKFKRWVVDIGQLAAGVILVSGVVLGVVSLLSDPNQQTPSQMAETNAENSAKKAKTAETNAKASADKAAVVAGEAERALGIVGGFEEKFATQVTQVGVVLDQVETKSKQIDERLNSAEKLLQKGDEYSKKAEDAAARSEAEANKVTTEMKAEVKKAEEAAARAEAEASKVATEVKAEVAAELKKAEDAATEAKRVMEEIKKQAAEIQKQAAEMRKDIDEIKKAEAEQVEADKAVQNVTESNHPPIAMDQFPYSGDQIKVVSSDR